MNINRVCDQFSEKILHSQKVCVNGVLKPSLNSIISVKRATKCVCVVGGGGGLVKFDD